MNDDLVKRLRKLAGLHVGFAPRLIHEAADRIEALEAAITDALRSRDEDMRDILRKGLHGGEE